MTALQKNVKQAQFLIMVGDWLRALGWCIVGAAIIWTVSVIAARLFEWTLPLQQTAAVLGGVALLTSFIWARLCKKDSLEAAMALDEAAGLKERTSSSLFCEHQDDPFAKAAAQDAEKINQKLTARSFIRIQWPSSMSFATVAILAALIVPILPIDPLQQSADATMTSQEDREKLKKQEVIRVKKRLEPLKKLADENATLKKLEEQLRSIDDIPLDKLKTPESVRREAIKNVDRMADYLRKQRDNAEFNQHKQLKRMFRGMKAVQQPKTPVDQLTKALAKGDFRTAKDALNKMREQLAKMKQKPDQQQMEKMKQQLDKLSKQLEKAAQQEQQKSKLEQELKQAGVDKETAKRASQRLTKQDREDVKEQMKKQGADQQKMQQMMKKMESMQQAQKQCQNMSNSMQKAAEGMQKQGQSSMADAAQALQQASEMLDSMESMEQQLSEMDSALNDMQDLKDDLAKSGDQNSCSKCNGSGCQKCGGSGGQQKGDGGQGKKPQDGRGGWAEEERTKIRWRKVRTPVNTGKGSIISKMFVDGEQVRGDVSSEAVELMTAAEREATDAIDKQKVPNQFKRAVKDYFSRIRTDMSKGDETSEASGDVQSGEASSEDTGGEQESTE